MNCDICRRDIAYCPHTLSANNLVEDYRQAVIHSLNNYHIWMGLGDQRNIDIAIASVNIELALRKEIIKRICDE